MATVTQKAITAEEFFLIDGDPGQKLELVRGKSARVLGNATALLVLIKGLPLAYNKDLQETQQPLFDSADTLLQMLPGFRGVKRMTYASALTDLRTRRSTRTTAPHRPTRATSELAGPTASYKSQPSCDASTGRHERATTDRGGRSVAEPLGAGYQGPFP